MDEYSNNKIELTQRELTFIKSAEHDKGWRLGLLVGAIFDAVAIVAAFIFTKLV